jgi:hypothetical protein
MGSPHHIETLKEAIQGAIDYMRRLPVVPATHEQIRKLELVLDAVPVGMLGGQCYDPVGRAIIDAQLSGKILSLRTSFERSEAEDLHHHLKTGLSSSWGGTFVRQPAGGGLGGHGCETWKSKKPAKTRASCFLGAPHRHWLLADALLG